MVIILLPYDDLRKYSIVLMQGVDTIRVRLDKGVR